MDLLQMHLKALGLPIPEKEWRFLTNRWWRFDYAWPLTRLAIEIEGGAWIRGRHTRGKGFLADIEKYNCASILGWSILRFTPQQIENGDAVLTVKRWFDAQNHANIHS